MESVAQEEADRGRFAGIAAAIACVSVVGIGISLSVPLLSLEMERMGISGTLIGLNTAIAGVASICVVPFVPRLAARIGVLPLLWGSILVSALSLVAFKVLFDFVWWFPVRFVFSAALGTLFVLSEFWINAAAPPARRGFVMGIYATVLALGFAGGPGLLALVGTEGWLPYLAGAALFGVASLPLLLAGRFSPEVGHATRPVFSFLRMAPAATVAAFVFGAVETGAFALLPVYGLRLGFEAASAAFLVSLMALGNVAFQIPIGLLSDRFDRRRVLLCIGVFGAVGAALIPVAAANMPAFFALLFVWGGVTGALYTVGLAHLGARFRDADLVSANAAFVILYNVGLVIGPPLVGAGMDAVPPQGFAYALAGLLGFYVLVVGSRLAGAERAAVSVRS